MQEKLRPRSQYHIVEFVFQNLGVDNGGIKYSLLIAAV
jgi:hypothetical protein